ncbi:MAG: hypothetical protein ACD_12C00207G0001 [uncultured bacterium]|nr:MAG: hypothetical protein ACD_12C00207G0001 [uncultured bacterium]
MLPQFTDRLDKERQLVFQKLKSFSKKFVLAGGTAIMLQIGRRLSYDFDCFCEEWELPLNIMTKARQVFGSKIIVKLQTPEMISFTTETGIEVSFVSHPFKILQSVIRTDTISLFHLDDLAANKAYTIGRRNTWRDYVDIFIFMKSKIYSLKKIIELADKKFKGEFNEKLFLGQLTYFKDLDAVHVEYLNQSYSEQEIKQYLENEVSSYVKSKI